MRLDDDDDNDGEDDDDDGGGGGGVLVGRPVPSSLWLRCSRRRRGEFYWRWHDRQCTAGGWRLGHRSSSEDRRERHDSIQLHWANVTHDFIKRLADVVVPLLLCVDFQLLRVLHSNSQSSGCVCHVVLALFVLWPYLLWLPHWPLHQPSMASTLTFASTFYGFHTDLCINLLWLPHWPLHQPSMASTLTFASTFYGFHTDLCINLLWLPLWPLHHDLLTFVP